MKKPILILTLLTISIVASSQVRQNIANLSSQQQSDLATQILNYLSSEIISTHSSSMAASAPMPVMVHANENFLPFHREYLAGLEDYLVLKGFSQFVPLPKWTPEDGISIPFQQVSTHCNDAYPGPAGSPGGYDCPPLYNTTPHIGRAMISHFPWSIDPDICNYSQNDIIGNSQTPSYIETPWHNEVHSNTQYGVRGVMALPKSPGAVIFWPWHAYVDDKWKEWECNCNGAPAVDLWMRDTPMQLGLTPSSIHTMSMDRGLEPNNESVPNYMWISKDIWVRSQPDGLTTDEHQDPEWASGQPVYVYVRVRNKGCQTSLGTEQLNLRWAKASTALSWEAHWDGSLTCTGSGASMGDHVSTKTIPPIPAGGQTIIEFEWYPPNPDDYLNCVNVWDPAEWQHFCLLARILATNDPMYAQEGNDLYDNVKKNNNIVWKNITITNDLPGIPPPGACDNERRKGGIIAVGNPFDYPDTYNLEFLLPDKYRETHILEEAEIRVELDPVTWDKWAAGGYQAENVEIRREDCRQIIINSNNASIKNLYYDEFERSLIFVSFNFLTDKVTSNPEFEYHVVQTRTEDRKIIGGEMYQIKKPTRYLFGADAGSDQTISKDDSTTLSAGSIGEPAIYNWYDPAGYLVYTGQDFTVSPEVTSKYKLEIIALSDGFVDYDSLTVTVKEFEIKSINPNPATSEITVGYRADNATSAYLQITQTYNNSSNNYILNTAQHSITINTSNYTPGIYSVILFCNGQASDVKQLVIQ